MAKYNLTDEQIKILEHDGDMKIVAVAGSGKTSTVIEYAKTRDKNSKIFSPDFGVSICMYACIYIWH